MICICASSSVIELRRRASIFLTAPPDHASIPRAYKYPQYCAVALAVDMDKHLGQRDRDKDMVIDMDMDMVADMDMDMV